MFAGRRGYAADAGFNMAQAGVRTTAGPKRRRHGGIYRMLYAPWDLLNSELCISTTPALK